MSSPDARLSTALPAHPKMKKLIRRLGPGAGWSFVCLILWARVNRPDGDLSGLSNEDIELAVDWSGELDAFVPALAAVGFLDGEPESYRLHDWSDHQPWASGSDLRSAKARWNAVKRHHGEAEADRQVPEWATVRHAASNAASTKKDAASSATSMLPAMHAASNSNAPSPSPSPSEELSSSLRSDSSPGKPEDRPAELTLSAPVAVADRRAERLAQVTDDAIAAFNACPGLTKAEGGALPNVSRTVGRDRRRQQVERCLKTARAICREQFGSDRVTREFWDDYFAEVQRDDFMAGRRRGGQGHENWTPDFEYLTRDATMVKVYDRAASTGEAA